MFLPSFCADNEGSFTRALVQTVPTGEPARLTCVILTLALPKPPCLLSLLAHCHSWGCLPPEVQASASSFPPPYSRTWSWRAPAHLLAAPSAVPVTGFEPGVLESVYQDTLVVRNRNWLLEAEEEFLHMPYGSSQNGSEAWRTRLRKSQEVQQP